MDYFQYLTSARAIEVVSESSLIFLPYVWYINVGSLTLMFTSYGTGAEGNDSWKTVGKGGTGTKNRWLDYEKLLKLLPKVLQLYINDFLTTFIFISLNILCFIYLINT